MRFWKQAQPGSMTLHLKPGLNIGFKARARLGLAKLGSFHLYTTFIFLNAAKNNLGPIKNFQQKLELGSSSFRNSLSLFFFTFDPSFEKMFEALRVWTENEIVEGKWSKVRQNHYVMSPFNELSQLVQVAFLKIIRLKTSSNAEFNWPLMTCLLLLMLHSCLNLNYYQSILALIRWSCYEPMSWAFDW